MNIRSVNGMTILHLGKRIRAIRRRQNKSLEEIARQIGITKSHLSQVERGKVNPSVNTLWSLADALRTSVSNLVSVTEQKGTYLNSIEAQFISNGVKCLSLYPASGHNIEFSYVEYEPGSSTGKQLGKHGGIEYFLVLEGTIKFILGNEEYILNKEQSIQFSGDTPHAVENIMDKKATAIYVIIPEEGKAD